VTSLQQDEKKCYFLLLFYHYHMAMMHQRRQLFVCKDEVQFKRDLLLTDSISAGFEYDEQ